MKPGIYKLRVKQPDRIIMWIKFQWFKLTKPKEYKEMKRFVDNTYQGAIDAVLEQIHESQKSMGVPRIMCGSDNGTEK